MSDFEITENIKEFILGGRANFTIAQEATDKTGFKQFKYKVTIPKGCDINNTNVWYVYAEVCKDLPFGDHNDGKNLQYVGYLKRDLSFNLGEKGDPNYNQVAINGLTWVLRHSDKLPSVVHIYHHGKCSVCGRGLTDAKSLRCGVGPTCRKKVGIID